MAPLTVGCARVDGVLVVDATTDGILLDDLKTHGTVAIGLIVIRQRAESPVLSVLVRWVVASLLDVE